MLHRLAHLLRTQSLGAAALLLVLTGGTAYAAGVAAEGSVTSRSIKDGHVRTRDLAHDAVNGAKVAPDALSGADIDEGTLASVPSADRVGGIPSGSLLRSAVYKAESLNAAGTPLADGTHLLNTACLPGDVLLSGGVANVGATSTLLESFPTPGTTNGWSGRIHKNGTPDNFSVVVLCADQ